ncbi:MAG TPA: tyrosine-protein phosphatase [Candidatus Binataceae bacterium]|nr:tyrosine-protein phosphatase [Candidatus Binataceae bacterium]
MPEEAKNFTVKVEGAKPRVVVDFELLKRYGGLNFRDLGGHPANNRRVRHHHIYRSAHLATIPEESPIPALKLRTIVTLQSRLELSYLGKPHADLLQAAERWEHIPIGDRWFKPEGFQKIATKPGHEHLVILTEFPTDWQAFFKLLAEPDSYPLLFHCSAGRDRTGVGAAILLELLGVTRDLIVKDFLASNTTFPKIPLTAEQLTPIFELIDESGGIENFMLEVLGLDRGDLDQIRLNLLADHVD